MSYQESNSGDLCLWRVNLRINSKSAAGLLLQPNGVESRYNIAPLMDGCSSDSARAGHSSSIAMEMIQNIFSAHCAEESTAVDAGVKCSRLLKMSSGEPLSTVVYEEMSSTQRMRRSSPFNGDVIRQLREGRGNMSQEALAEAVGTTKANVSKWERSRAYVAISYDIFMNLARVLYIAPEELAKRLGASAPQKASTPAQSPAARKRP